MSVSRPKLHAVGGTEGPPIVLLHGFGADRLSWLANISELAKAGQVYALDLPGHGETGLTGDGALAEISTFVAEAIAAAKFGPVHLVGHSLGGAVAISIAASHPGFARSLTVLAAAGLGKGIDRDFLFGFPRLERPEEAEALLHRLVARPRLINKFMVARLLEQLDVSGARQRLAGIAAGLQGVDSELAPSRDKLSASPLRRLTIWGEIDPITPLDQEKLAAFGGEHLILSETAHLPHVESARLVNARLIEFLTAHC